MNSVNKKVHVIGEEDQEEFVKHAGDLCRVPTLLEFDLIFAGMKQIFSKYLQYGSSLASHPSKNGTIIYPRDLPT